MKQNYSKRLQDGNKHRKRSQEDSCYLSANEGTQAIVGHVQLVICLPHGYLSCLVPWAMQTVLTETTPFDRPNFHCKCMTS